jgi:uncharacterized protein (DUF1800 family)
MMGLGKFAPAQSARWRLGVAGVVAAATLAACGGGGGGGGGSGGATVQAAGPPAILVSEAEATRLADQASFGPTPALIEEIRRRGVAGWITDQMALRGSGYRDIIEARRGPDMPECAGLSFVGNALGLCRANYNAVLPVASRFYRNAAVEPDQLRQRVALALSQILVVSEVEVDSTAGLAAYQQILLDNAFGNYRDILTQITLNPYMGQYLDMWGSSRAGPNTNYARELLQLFSVYVVELNIDGTRRLDAAGNPIPTYSEADVAAISRALTGWTGAQNAGATTASLIRFDYATSMIPGAATTYDSAEKRFLGRVVPAGATPRESVDAVIDAVFNHPNVGPYIGKQLIQQLVTSNPSPAYVTRVAQTFNNNGAGVRGDLSAVVRAIMTDPEARGDPSGSRTTGKLKEPILQLTAAMRMIPVASTDGYAAYVRGTTVGQPVFESPSVFNFYPPDHGLSFTPDLLSPPSKLLNDFTAHQRHNVLYDWTILGDQTRAEYNPNTAALLGATGTTVDWSGWEALAGDPDRIIDRIDLLAFNRAMTGPQRDAMRTAIAAVTNADPTIQARRRAQTALYIATTSPHFLVDR